MKRTPMTEKDKMLQNDTSVAKQNASCIILQQSSEGRSSDAIVISH